MTILHTESSNGWGGQEIRILKEAEGMRERGYQCLFAVQRGGKLVDRARAAGFVVYEVPFAKYRAPYVLLRLHQICRSHNVTLINTHSSLDAWLGGITARLAGIKVIRTRHLSTPIRPGLNSRLLYNRLADFVATTSSAIIPMITQQSGKPSHHVRCVPTGIDPTVIKASEEEAAGFRRSLGIAPCDILVGTACVVRSWKGILDFLQAAVLLKAHPHIKWVIVGGGYLEQYVPKLAEWDLSGHVIFTGHLENPFPAIRAMDIFTLLSTAHEGISQASLQAAFFNKPLITTDIGGLPEVCLHEKTGIVVPPHCAKQVAEAVLRLANNPSLRTSWGEAAHALVAQKFTLKHTLDGMEELYAAMGLPSRLL